LVFSDEFETPGRTFYPGDDPFWEAVDLHYWGTGDLEWYDPCKLFETVFVIRRFIDDYAPISATITTEDGKMVITITEQQNHDLNFMSGMVTSWNKVGFIIIIWLFCI